MSPGPEADEVPTNLRQKTYSGFSWVMAGKFAAYAINLGFYVVLARILGPEAYGVVAIATLFVAFADLFDDVGLGPALIQRKEVSERHLSTAFWANIALGVTVWLVLTALSPLAASFFGEPLIQWILPALAFSFVIGSLNTVQRALLVRRMEYRHVVVRRGVGSLLGGTVAVVIAVQGGGAWALVVKQLAQSTFAVVLLWRVGGWRPRFLFDRDAFKQLMGFGGYLTGFNLVNFVVRHLDQVLIGRFVGLAPLALYNRAYSFMTLPMRQFSRAMGRVSFSALARIQDDLARVRRNYLLGSRVVMLMSAPIAAAFLVISDDFVRVLLGPKWLGVVPILEVLAWVGLVQPTNATAGWIYKSMGETRLQFRVNLVFATVAVIAFSIGIQYGVMGVAWAYVIRGAILWPFAIAIPGRLIDLILRRWFRNVGPSLLAALSMAGVLWMVRQILDGQGVTSPALRLTTFVSMGVFWYWHVNHQLRLRAYRDALRIVVRQGGTILKRIPGIRRVLRA